MTGEGSACASSPAVPAARGSLIDASFGRKTRAVLVMDSDHVVLSALEPEELIKRDNAKKDVP